MSDAMEQPVITSTSTTTPPNMYYNWFLNLYSCTTTVNLFYNTTYSTFSHMIADPSIMVELTVFYSIQRQPRLIHQEIQWTMKIRKLWAIPVPLSPFSSHSFQHKFISLISEHIWRLPAEDLFQYRWSSPPSAGVSECTRNQFLGPEVTRSTA